MPRWALPVQMCSLLVHHHPQRVHPANLPKKGKAKRKQAAKREEKKSGNSTSPSPKAGSRPTTADVEDAPEDALAEAPAAIAEGAIVPDEIDISEDLIPGNIGAAFDRALASGELAALLAEAKAADLPNRLGAAFDTAFSSGELASEIAAQADLPSRFIAPLKKRRR